MQGKIEELKAVGADVVAASSDPEDKLRELGANLPFPLAHGVTEAVAASIGAWWEPKRGFIQPSEFIIAADGKVLSSTYSSGPIGRVEPADVVSLLRMYESRRA